jgi:tetratricopeptide (TPR) repeat protein
MALYKDSLVLKRELGDKRGIATTLGNLGAMCLDQGDIATARVYAEESLTLFRQTGDKRSQASALNNVGELYFEQGDLATARRHYVDSVKLRQELGERLGLIELIEDFARLCTAQNQPARAVQLAGAAGSLRQTLGIPPHAASGKRLERNLEPTKEQLTADEWARIWAEGEAMTLDEAVIFALCEEEPAVAAPRDSSDTFPML